MTKPRPPRRAVDDDGWSPRDIARMKRRLFNKLRERWPPEVQEAYRRHQAAEHAARGKGEG